MRFWPWSPAKPKRRTFSSLLHLVTSARDTSDASNVVRVGRLASCDAADEAGFERVRALLKAGRWSEAAELQSGSIASDWLVWYLIEYDDGTGSIVEAYYPLDYFFNDSWQMIATLGERDVVEAGKCVVRWEEVGENDARQRRT